VKIAVESGAAADAADTGACVGGCTVEVLKAEDSQECLMISKKALATGFDTLRSFLDPPFGIPVLTP